MITLSIAVSGLVLLLVATVVMARKSASLSLECDLVASEVQNLPPTEAARLNAWDVSLEAQGFRRLSDFRIEDKAAPMRNHQQTQQLRVWISPDRKSWAYATHIVTLSSARDNVALTSLTLGFLSRLADGSFIKTNNYARDDSIECPRSISYRRFAWLIDATSLHLAHHRHLEERAVSNPLREFQDHDFASLLLTIRKIGLDSMVERGYLAPRGDRAFMTTKGAVVGFISIAIPFRSNEDRGWIAALKLLALAAASVGVAWAIVHHSTEGQARWVLSALFVMTSLISMLVFPLTRLFSWVYVLLPAGISLELQHRGDWLPWLAAAATVGWLGGKLENWRYRRLAAAFDPQSLMITAPTRPSLANTLIILSGLAAGGAIALWICSAREAPSLQAVMALWAISLAGFAGCLMTLVTVVLDFISSVKNRSGYRLFRAMSYGLLMICFGVTGGWWLKATDSQVSLTRMLAVQSALERYRADRGEYPDRLELLVPRYLPELLRARLGLRSPNFEYQSEKIARDGRPPRCLKYRLEYRSAWGPFPLTEKDLPENADPDKHVQEEKSQESRPPGR